MRATLTADELYVEGDEDGWKLYLSTDDGDEFVIRIHHLAENLHKNVDETIGAWLREAEDARAVHPGQLDLDAYPLGDPKRITLEREMNR